MLRQLRAEHCGTRARNYLIEKAGGAEGNRTPDLCSAIAALSHLSYSPAPPAGSGPDGVGPLGKRLPSGLAEPLQSLVPRQLRPAEFAPRFGVRDRNGRERPFVSSAAYDRCLTGVFRREMIEMAYDRYDTRNERSRWSGDDRSPNATAPGTASAASGSGRRDERGFFERAGDEIASWFGDDDAERRQHQEGRDRHSNRASAAALESRAAAPATDGTSTAIATERSGGRDDRWREIAAHSRAAVLASATTTATRAANIPTAASTASAPMSAIAAGTTVTSRWPAIMAAALVAGPRAATLRAVAEPMGARRISRHEPRGVSELDRSLARTAPTARAPTASIRIITAGATAT